MRLPINIFVLVYTNMLYTLAMAFWQCSPCFFFFTEQRTMVTPQAYSLSFDKIVPSAQFPSFLFVSQPRKTCDTCLPTYFRDSVSVTALSRSESLCTASTQLCNKDRCFTTILSLSHSPFLNYKSNTLERVLHHGIYSFSLPSTAYSSFSYACANSSFLSHKSISLVAEDFNTIRW